MRLQILSELQTEINRLFIAGSKLAKDDPRLMRLVPTLKKMGERAPVFMRLAQGVEALASAEPDESGERLLELGTLLYSVLYTQGDTSAAGDYEALPTSPETPEFHSVHTRHSYSRLYPLIEALTTHKSGRLEVIRQAHKDGLFDDVRTHEAAAYALDDKYAEIAGELEDAIIPSIGRAAIPSLLRQYDPQGDKGAARRLALLGKLGYEGAQKLAQDALNAGKTSVPVSVAAICILGRNPANEGLLVALCRDKKKDIREAAMLALARLDSAEGKRLILETFKGKGYASAIEPLAACRDAATKLEALAVVKELERACLAEGIDEKELALRAGKFAVCAEVLRGAPHPDIIRFIQDSMTSRELRKALSESAHVLNDIYRALLGCLVSFREEQGDRALESLARDRELVKAHRGVVSSWFRAAARTFPRERMYREFADRYRKGLLGYNDFRETYAELSSVDERWIGEFLFAEINGYRDYDRLLGVEMTDPADRKQVRQLVGFLKDDLKRSSKEKTRYAPCYLSPMLEKLKAAGELGEAEALFKKYRNPESRYHEGFARLLSNMNEMEAHP